PSLSGEGGMRLHRSKQVVCVLLGCAVDPEAATATASIREILKRGVPAIVWLRRPSADPDALREALTRLVNTPVPGLPLAVWGQRSQDSPDHPDDHLSRNIGLLVEDPGRVPPEIWTPV